MKPIIIVGAGWAGLATAAELCHHDIPVILVEAAPQIGGRARSFQWGPRRVDNGQHLLLGAYQTILELLERSGVPEEQVLQRHPLSLSLRSPSGLDIHLQAADLPTPLHLIKILLGRTRLTIRERLQILWFFLQMERRIHWPEPDCTAELLLAQQGQSPFLLRSLWEPLCLAALNTPLAKASAQIFIKTLRDSLVNRRTDSDLLLPLRDLSAVFPEPMQTFIRHRGGQVWTRCRVTQLALHNHRVSGVRTSRGVLVAQHVVLAVPPHMALRLLVPHPQCYCVVKQLEQLRYAPIITIYLQYPEATRLDRPLLGLLETHSQWVFDRQHCGQPGLMAVVMSAAQPYLGQDRESLGALASGELAHFFPAWPAPQDAQVIKEKRATFISAVGVNQHRPGNRTPLEGCYLAGDYTATGYPATLEGAVRSGLQCAYQILNDL